MESSYSKDTQQSRDAKQEQRQQQKVTEQRRQADAPSAAFVHAAQLLQSGAKLRDLSPEEAREVAAAVGNQTVLQLLRGGDPIPLAPAPPGRETERTLPVTAVDVRWPALNTLPELPRSGPFPEGVFPVEHFRPMGQYAGGGVIPNG